MSGRTCAHCSEPAIFKVGEDLCEEHFKETMLAMDRADAVEALRMLQALNAPFVSRGQN